MCEIPDPVQTGSRLYQNRIRGVASIMYVTDNDVIINISSDSCNIQLIFKCLKVIDLIGTMVKLTSRPLRDDVHGDVMSEK